jgi:indolepyruvate ferredoxin oxidoreductase beta subunit
MYPDTEKKTFHSQMKTDIILSGVGGQGILSIAAIIGEAALNEGLYMKQAEVHGMSQRGGDVQSHLRLSSRPVASDLIPKGQAGLIISLEPMESLRYLPYLKENGWVVTNSRPYVNIPGYPDMEKLNGELSKLPRTVILDAEEMAREAGAARAANIVILGAAAPFLGLRYEKIEEGIRHIFKHKGEDTILLNLKALRKGFNVAQPLADRL